jgi:hypothetical protein
MATRQARLSEFNHGIAKANHPVQILCEDHCGTYVIPYACQWTDGVWRKLGSPKVIEAPRYRLACSAMILAMILFR